MKYLNALNKVPGIGPKKTKMLLEFFGNPENIWKAGLENLKLSRIGEKTAENLYSERKNINPDEEWEKVEKENIQMVTFGNAEYPALLKEIPSPPYTIYKKGNINLNEGLMIAIVGSRKYTSYGSQVARSFAKDLVGAGITVVSGMALGIDSFAHRGALDGVGKTVAVLGNSLDDKSIYPQNNFGLSREIILTGALLSEYPIETTAGKLTFPARNRIIAGLTLGTLVVEAGEKSGALITAQMALECNREVFSIPGSIFSPASVGTNELLKSGAKVVMGVRDILEELDIGNLDRKKTTVPKNPDTPEEKTILSVMEGGPIHIDNISKLAKLQTAVVSGTLTAMEIKGWVKNIGGQNYIIL